MSTITYAVNGKQYVCVMTGDNPKVPELSAEVPEMHTPNEQQRDLRICVAVTKRKPAASHFMRLLSVMMRQVSGCGLGWKGDQETP